MFSVCSRSRLGREQTVSWEGRIYMLIVSNLTLGLEEDDRHAIAAARKLLKVGEDQIARAAIHKKSLDARRRDKLRFVVSVAIELKDPQAEQALASPQAVWKPRPELRLTPGSRKLEGPIVIAGFGPAGIFAAHTLALQGYRPLVLERGAEADQRAAAVERFWKEGVLDPRTNVQFGEGGAGAFSDGKLTTRISDSRCGYVLEQLVRHGAPPEIRTAAKPHIGTDLLRNVIVSLRKEIVAHGGEVRFNAPVEDVVLENGRVTGVRVNGMELPAAHLILAVGHSARDTFRLLADRGLRMEGKDFSVGVRIEQLQAVIDRGLYGQWAGHPSLPKGEYQLSHRSGGRCVYTFCMCPGGYVVPSSSEPGMVVTNGMSRHLRDGVNANAALVVSVGAKDFGTNPLDGIRFQEQLERRAFELGGSDYRAPAMTVGGFLNGGPMKLGKVEPTYALGVTEADFSRLFPEELLGQLRLGIEQFQRKLPGFGTPDGILTGVESRTSSPVRLMRGEDCAALGIGGLYPCGEGAGYAGGIMSAAVDGIRVAEQLISLYAPCAL